MKPHKITLKPDGSLKVRVSAKHAAAITAIKNMKTFEGTKVMALIADVYRVGQKDGAKQTFDAIELLK
ncbi:MAG TPA: hypothetical protein VHD62_14700 [Opitutaceae bacterium]|nr:hypothetical protein [Opitutaceae bacterium]